MTCLAAALALGACGGDDSPAPPNNDVALYTVSHYDVALDLATRVATVTAKLSISTVGGCVTIPFQPDNVGAVTFDGVAARAVSVDAHKLTACLPNGAFALAATPALAVTATLPLATLDGSDVGYSVQTDAAGGTFTYVVSWLGGCSRHGICDDRPDTFATYTFTVAHDATTQVLCSGKITEADGKTTCDFTYAGGPTYSTFAIAARSPAWTKVDLGTWNGVAVTLYDEPGSGIAAAIDKTTLAAAFAWLEDTLGPYPYGDELRFFVAPTYWAGFEHPGNVALWDGLGAPQTVFANGLTHTCIHEMVHFWAGDQATLKGTYDFVWKESMAEYLSQVFEDEHIDHATAVQTAGAWKGWAADARYYLVPGEMPALLDYYGDVYGPGPMILFRQLEAMYSREQVLAAIKALVGTNAPRTLSIDDVQTALETALSADLTTYFAGWVHGEGEPQWPTLAPLVTDDGDDGVDVSVAVTSATTDGKPRGCSFIVRLKLVGGGTFDVTMNNGVEGGSYVTQIVQPGARVFGDIVDPENTCVFSPAALVKPERHRVEPWRRRR